MKLKKIILMVICLILICIFVMVICRELSLKKENIPKQIEKKMKQEKSQKKFNISDGLNEKKIKTSEEGEIIYEPTNNLPEEIKNNSTNFCTGEDEIQEESSTSIDMVQPSESQNPPSLTNDSSTNTEGKPLSAWERLEISEYKYYNTPMVAGDEVVFSGSLSLCEKEVTRLINLYYKQGLSGGNSYEILGKYTYSYIGCGLNVYINGIKYTYAEAKQMGFY